MPRKTRAAAPAVTLFPFLAVLLCLMGALVFLLMALSARVGVEPVVVAEPEPLPPRPPAEPVVSDVEPLPPRVSQEDVDAPHAAERDRLRDLLASIGEEIADREAALAAMNAAERDRAAALAAAVGRLDRERASLAAAEADAADLDAKLRTLAAKLTDLEAETSDRAAAVVARPTKFRILPVDRFTGTQRDPIVIECRPDGFRFAIEDVTVDADDFVGRRFTDNPLTNVIEALSVHYGSRGKQPYVLLLARPGAEQSFGLARGLLTKGGRKWGYELIPDGMELDWPPVDDDAQQVALAAVGPRGPGGQMLAGRDLSPTGDIYGLLRNQRLRSLAMTGRRPAAAGPAFRGSTGQSPADAFTGRHRRSTSSGFAAVARGRFDRPRTEGIDVTPVSERADAAPASRPRGDGFELPNRVAVTDDVGNDRASSVSNANSRDRGAGTAPAQASDELQRFAARSVRNRRDNGPHWMTDSASADAVPASRSRETAPGTLTDDVVTSDARNGGTSQTTNPDSRDRGAGAAPARPGKPRAVRPSRDAEDCLACRRKPWSSGGASGLIGWEREIAVTVDADSLSAGELDLPKAGTFPSKTLARLLTELTLVKLDEWGEPRPGMYWSPVLVLDGAGPMAARVEQAAEIAEIPVRRRRTR